MLGMPHVELIDNDTVGPDNRPVGESPQTFYADTDANGRAEWTIEVSMQPGNNYRAGASVLQDAINQAEQADADALSTVFDEEFQGYFRNGNFSGYQVPLVWSEMLTVWRKLTLEVDSMDQESQEFSVRFANNAFEHDKCEVGSLSVDDPSVGFTTVRCTDNDDHDMAYAGTNFFEGGAFVRNNTGTEFLIVRSWLEDRNVVIVWGNPGADVVGTMCTLRDDDLYFHSPESPRQLPRTSVLDSNIVTAYRDAYIEVVEATPGSVNLVNIIDWRSNLPVERLISDYTLLQGVSYQWDVGASDGFWARHVVVCYQAGTNEEADGDEHENSGISQNCLAVEAPYPLLPLSALPQMDKILGRTVRNELFYKTALSTVYVESIRDNTTDGFSAKLWQYVAHEVGHSTLDQNENQAGLGAEHSEGALMSEGNTLQDYPGFQRFTATTLLRFREVKRW